MPSDIIKSFAKKSGKTEEEVEKMWNSIKRSLLDRMSEKDPSFYPQLVGALKKALKIEEIEEENEILFQNFKKKKLNKEEEKYSPAEILRNIIEILIDEEEEDTEDSEDTDEPEDADSEDSEDSEDTDEEEYKNKFTFVLEVLHELADEMPEEVVEKINDALLDYYSFDEFEDDEDDKEDEDDEEVNESLIYEKVNQIKAKRLRFLKMKRKKQLGKRAQSLQFKRSYYFDTKKKRFVKRQKSLDAITIKKKARRLKKILRKAATKRKIQRTKKRLRFVKNPYK